MNGLMLATYVLKVQQQVQSRDQQRGDVDEKAAGGGLRAFAPLLAGFAGIVTWVVALDILK